MSAVDAAVNPEKACRCLTLPHVTGRFPRVDGGGPAPVQAGRPKALPSEVAAVPDDPAQSRGGRILVVDDEPHIRRVLSSILEREGFEVDLASDGPEGLDAVVGGGIDLVILDLMMPSANGLEILAQIRAHPERGDTPVIILTAKGQDTDREAALAGGADDFLTKPFSPKKLIARIHEILGDG